RRHVHRRDRVDRRPGEVGHHGAGRDDSAAPAVHQRAVPGLGSGLGAGGSGVGSAGDVADGSGFGSGSVASGGGVGSASDSSGPDSTGAGVSAGGGTATIGGGVTYP